MHALPIHFFTIVLNGEPFIRYHIDLLQTLPFPWHWHIIEGVADLKHDTAWPLENGGHITGEIHNGGLSNDGTTRYLNALKDRFPNNISLYRKPMGIHWDGKREMVNAPLSQITEEAILFQLDSDELWGREQIVTLHEMFEQYPQKTSAWFWCWFFVGHDLVVSSRNCYSSNPVCEWQRAWRFSPGCRWGAHEPPMLLNSEGEDLGRKNPFTHFDTEKKDLLFQHYSYVTEKQLRFKEIYYGYTNAVEKWKDLQNVHSYPLLLRDYFSWVEDSTVVEPASRFALDRRAVYSKGEWVFCHAHPIKAEGENQQSACTIQILSDNRSSPKIVIDGVYFSVTQRGITRVWQEVLTRWGRDGYGENVVLLDRGGTVPEIPGIRTRTIPAYDPNRQQEDSELLERICREENASMFSSTYYTTPLSTPSLLVIYDMIPELLQWDMTSNTDWQDKNRAIQHASHVMCISHNTKKDLLTFQPHINEENAHVAWLACDTNIFKPAESDAIIHFHQKYKIEKPYFLLVGPRLDYKNAQLLFDALSVFPAQHGYGIFCTSAPQDVYDYAALRTGCEIYMHKLTDEELSVAYTGAVALVFPSTCEGFGLPILEAFSCHCPVVAYPHAAIQEVAEDGALYASTKEDLSSAICEVQKPKTRKRLMQNGIKRLTQFSWDKTAEEWMEAFQLASSGSKESKALSSGIVHSADETSMRNTIYPG